MFRMKAFNNADAAVEYYMGKYYTGKPGMWGGRGAEMLGLSGEVSREDFADVCSNRRPDDGQRLTARDNEERRVGYDFHFSVPKSVTVLLELGGDERIIEAMEEAVVETMLEMEEEMKVRARANGADEDRISGNMMWAAFLDRKARPVGGIPDPQLHYHVFVPNASFDPVEEKWKAGQFGDLKRDAPYYQAAQESRLAEKLVELGYKVEKHRKGWEIVGISQEVNKTFSRRTEQVEEYAQEHGLITDKEKDGVGAVTREMTDSFELEELTEIWDSMVTEEQRQKIREVVAEAVDGEAEPSEMTADDGIDFAVEHGFVMRSYMGERRFLAQALEYSVGAVGVDQMWESLSQRSEILVKEEDGEQVVTTQKVWDEEKWMVAFARDGKGTRYKLLEEQYEFTQDFLNDEQKGAVNQLLSSGDRVMILSGRAGVGKTTALCEVIRGIEQGGRKVFAFAPGTESSRGVMREDGIKNDISALKEATTVAALLKNERLQAQIQDQVILVDEAGQVSGIDMAKIFRIAEERNARVILSGDTHQHRAVQRGDAFRLIEDMAAITPAEITRIQRQRDRNTGRLTTYGEAVKLLSEGDIVGGFDRLDDLGMVVEIDDLTELQGVFAEHYLKAMDEKRSAVVVSPTHRQGAKVTATIREGLRERGMLEKEEREVLRLRNLYWSDAELGDVRNYEAGMIVQFEQNVRSGDEQRNIERGERFLVRGRNDAGNVEMVDVDGKVLVLPAKRPEDFNVYEAGLVDLAKGDLIRITKNGFATDKEYELRNGRVYQVEGFADDGNLVVALPRDLKKPKAKRIQRVIDKNYGNLAYGYYTTSDSVQGRTVDLAFGVQTAESFPAASEEQYYVTMSRAREGGITFTDSKKELKEAIQRSSKRKSALEVFGDQKPETEQERFYRLVNMDKHRRRRAARQELRERMAAEMEGVASKYGDEPSYAEATEGVPVPDEASSYAKATDDRSEGVPEDEPVSAGIATQVEAGETPVVDKYSRVQRSPDRQTLVDKFGAGKRDPEKQALVEKHSGTKGKDKNGDIERDPTGE